MVVEVRHVVMSDWMKKGFQVGFSVFIDYHGADGVNQIWHEVNESLDLFISCRNDCGTFSVEVTMDKSCVRSLSSLENNSCGVTWNDNIKIMILSFLCSLGIEDSEESIGLMSVRSYENFDFLIFFQNVVNFDFLKLEEASMSTFVFESILKGLHDLFGDFIDLLIYFQGVDQLMSWLLELVHLKILDRDDLGVEDEHQLLLGLGGWNFVVPVGLVLVPECLLGIGNDKLADVV